MTNRDLLAGLTILSKYVAPEGYNGHATHEELAFGPDDPGMVSPEDAAELRRLGWYINTDLQMWSAFVLK